jgi:hypothetical protein
MSQSSISVELRLSIFVMIMIEYIFNHINLCGQS